MILGTPDAGKLKINHLHIFKALKENYIDSSKELDKMREAAKEYKKLQEEIIEKKTILDRIQQDLKVKGEKLKTFSVFILFVHVLFSIPFSIQTPSTNCISCNIFRGISK